MQYQNVLNKYFKYLLYEGTNQLIDEMKNGLNFCRKAGLIFRKAGLIFRKAGLIFRKF